ncbi:MAG: cation:proton antiporter [Dermatophilaceae bacterium]
MSFTNLLLVSLVAVLAPLVARASPVVQIPSPVLEILTGLVLGPSVIGWVRIDAPLEVLSLVGLAFLLFLAGMEVDAHQLQGSRLRLATGGFALSLAIAVLVSVALGGGGVTTSPLLVAITLCATALGLVVPILKDARQIATDTGQLVVAAASIADFGAVILISLLFSQSSAGVGSTLLLLCGLGLAAAVTVLLARRTARCAPVARAVRALQDTTAQIRVRGAVLLLIAFVVLAEKLGFELILGAFVAGAVLRLADADGDAHHPHLHAKLDAIGYGFVVPVFFVVSGLQLDVAALLSTSSAVSQVPLFLGALLMVRGLPALLYRSQVGLRRAVAAGLLQSTSLPFMVASVAIGLRLDALAPATGTALVASGLLSVMVFPSVAISLLNRADDAAGT